MIFFFFFIYRNLENHVNGKVATRLEQCYLKLLAMAWASELKYMIKLENSYRISSFRNKIFIRSKCI